MLATVRKLHRELFRAYCDLSTTSAIAAQRFIEELQQAYVDEKRLERSGYKVYSQSDEDGILAEHWDVLQPVPATSKNPNTMF